MIVEFPKEDMDAHLVEPHYKMVMEMHMHYEKMHTKQQLIYIKYVGFFILSCLGFIIMQEKGFIDDYLIAIVFTGSGVLFASVMTMLFTSGNIDWKRALYEEEGKKLEEKYQPMINSNYFQAIDNLKISRYRVTLFSRLVPFAFVGVSTVWSAVMLSIKTSSNFAAFVGILSLVILVSSMGFLARNMKKCQN